MHRGGAFILLADGSVRFLRDSASPHTLEGLATIAGNDEPGEDF